MLALYGLVAVVLDAAEWFASGRGTARASPFVSVLVLVRNREDAVERFLGALCGLGADGGVLDYEVVAVDDYSTDQTWPIIERLAADRGILKAVRMGDVSSPGESPESIGLFMCAGDLALVCRLVHGADDVELIRAVKGMLSKSRRRPPVLAG
jgi:glycosyltransferase involved in cell wall biosynthesis